MTINQLASKLCKLEAKKSQINIGDMRELLKTYATLVANQMFSEIEKIPDELHCFNDEINKIYFKLKKQKSKTTNKKGK